MTDIQAFRDEVREVLENRVPKSLRGQAGSAIIAGGKKARLTPEQKVYLSLMADRGWTAPTWPEEYGGGGLSGAHARELQREIGRLGLPAPLAGMGLSMIGPTLLSYGNEEQKREHLPKIVRGEIRWCQGYSEPNAGSDLASLQTSAVPDGDEYVINGQKIWTSGAQLADWIFTLVRTDKESKHNGITFILIDMETPGIEVRPIQLISGNSPFCETFFTDVRVPKTNVVGRVNQGWTIGKALLGHERSGMGQRRPPAMPGSKLADLAKSQCGEQEGRVADAAVRDALARLQLDQLALRLTVQRSTEGQKAGYEPGPETSMFKLYSTELGQRRENLTLTVRGAQALGWEGEGFSEAELAQTRSWLGGLASTIYGGTSEIQLNIISKRVLGLPE